MSGRDDTAAAATAAAAAAGFAIECDRGTEPEPECDCDCEALPVSTVPAPPFAPGDVFAVPIEPDVCFAPAFAVELDDALAFDPVCARKKSSESMSEIDGLRGGPPPPPDAPLAEPEPPGDAVSYGYGDVGLMYG